MKKVISLLLAVVLIAGCDKLLNKSQPEPDKTYAQNDERINPSPSPSPSSSPTPRPTSTPKPTPTPIPNQEQKQDKIEQRDSEAFAELEESESKGWYETSLKYAATAKDYAVAH